MSINEISGQSSFPDLTPEEQKVLHTIRRRKVELLQEINQLKDELNEVNSEIEAMDTEEGAKGLIKETPEDVAQFLYKGEGLNKTMIGDFLGEKNDFNEAVLKAFVELHDFTDLILVQALRQFLWSFRLPGEAQKIDRMMESFAQRYCQLNPDIFTNSDTCYVLSFAIIMLNTSLHNPSVKDKPSVEQFISMNRGINDGGDLPRELLVSLYDSIKTEPFKIPEDDGGRYKSWKRRWFILNDNCLYYFEFTTDKEPRGIIPLENIRVREVGDRNKSHCFELFSAGNEVIKACKTDSEGKVVEGKHTVYRMSASTEEEKEEWIKCIQRVQANEEEDIFLTLPRPSSSKSLAKMLTFCTSAPKYIKVQSISHNPFLRYVGCEEEEGSEERVSIDDIFDRVERLKRVSQYQNKRIKTLRKAPVNAIIIQEPSPTFPPRFPL
ncbi:CYTH [Lepeophtheirus salmonis]|uniref:CYTH n=1 Tax=Lepeophtheirus salmonis TaxID=72036 RepID=A0A7R8CC49_LEPSM|nr:CYTH [Lepeophtheirus salmonis]CAF2759908.1 CYTH [Lepeophtheirus salmonis]